MAGPMPIEDNMPLDAEMAIFSNPTLFHNGTRTSVPKEAIRRWRLLLQSRIGDQEVVAIKNVLQGFFKERLFCLVS